MAILVWKKIPCRAIHIGLVDEPPLSNGERPVGRNISRGEARRQRVSLELARVAQATQDHRAFAVKRRSCFYLGRFR